MNKHLSLVCVDSAVENFQSLIAGIKPNTQVMLLKPNQDGLAQITAVLAGFSNIASIHIVSHGSAGSLQLGNRFIDTKALQTPQILSLLQQWKASFAQGIEILLYGCEVAAGSVGKAFVEQLSRLTGVPVAASETKIGSAALGGNWELTYQTHPIISSLAFNHSVLETYRGVLTTERVSIAGDGSQSNNFSWFSSISGDGRYISFSSAANNLVVGDTNNTFDIFVHDRQTGQTSRVSVASNGSQGNNDSFESSISGDGRYVAFESDANNLVAGDTNGFRDIFVHDRATGETSRVSVASNGFQNDKSSWTPSISGNGQYVAFISDMDNVLGSRNPINYIYVHNRQTNETRRVSVASDGSPNNDSSWSPSLSADGRYVTFASGADNLVAGDTNGTFDVFVHDQQTGQTSRVSVASNGSQSNGYSGSSSISADGRYVAFASGADNLVAGDTNGLGDIFVHDRQTGETSLVSVTSNGSQSNSYSDFPSISADGRYVAFYSSANNLVAGDTNGFGDIFVHDRNTGQTSLVSIASNGSQSNGYSESSSISANGQSIAFMSSADNLVAGDTNGTFDVFVHTLAPTTSSVGDKVWNDSNLNGIQDTGESGIAGVTVQLYDSNNTLVASTNTDAEGLYSFNNLAAGDYSLKFVPITDFTFTTQDSGTDDSLDSDVDITTGQTAVFTLADWDNAGNWDAGLYFTGGQTERVSIADDGSQSNSNSGSFSISANGRYVAFESNANNLVTGDTNGTGDIFVHDRRTGETSLVAVASDGSQSNYTSRFPSISGDGRYVSFSSRADNLVMGDTNGTDDIFVHDLNTGQTSRVSIASDSSQSNSYSWYSSISADGQSVVFISDADNLVSGDTNGIWDIFVHDLQTNETSRVSIASDGSQSNNYSWTPSISGDGQYIVFMSDANNLVAGDTNGTDDIFVHNRQTGETRRVSVASNGSQSNNDSINPSMSKDGRYVAFYSYADNLVAGDTNGVGDIFVHDRQTGETSLVSVASDGTQSNYDSDSPSISADGRYVAFYSYADNLVAGDTNGVGDIFVHDRQTGETHRISVASNGTQGNNPSASPAISADGGSVAFYSNANNLVAGDTNGVSDIFVHTLGTLTTSSVSDKVWNDSNLNGIQDTGESGIAGVTVQLYDSNNTLVASTNTDAEGLYSFNNLAAGDYSLKFVPITDFTFTTQDSGTDDSLDSDVDITTGQTAVFTLADWDNAANWDAGLYQVRFTGTTAADSLTGNDGNNIMTGAAGNDTLIGNGGNDNLNGGAGDDSMVGGLGNDVYFVGTAGDTVVENANAGTDRVEASISYTLGNHVENLTLTGTGNTIGIGNELNNVIRGNAGNNTLIGNGGNDNLNGGAGDDSMVGGLGNDVYFVGTAGDTVVENANAGTDRVEASISYTLGNHVENLTLTGTGNTIGIGNELNNVIQGNISNNWLTGEAGHDSLNGIEGNDTLEGGAGNDTLTGGSGSDSILYNTGTVFNTADIGVDRINGFVSGTDHIVLNKATFAALISLAGTGFSVASEFATVITNAAADISQALIVYNSTNGELFYNENGVDAGLGNGGAFATLVGLPALSANDLLLL